MTDTNTRTLPKSVQQKALQAIAKITAWNQAVQAARRLERQHNRPGFDEYAIRTDKEHIPMRLACSHGRHALDQLEATLGAKGWTTQEVYTALGTPRPIPEPEGPHVVDWFEGQR